MWSVGLFLVIVPAVVIDTCTVDPVDVVFVLDSSGSMGTAGFQSEQDFVKQFTDLVQIGEEEFHIGVVQFITEGFIEFNLLTYFDKTSIKDAVQKIVYLDGGTSISSGLSKAKDVLDLTRRSSAVMYVVLITDGDLSYDKDIAFSVAGELKSNPALRIFVIGIGVAVPMEDLKKIASSPSYFLYVNQAAELAASVTSTANITCQAIKDCASSPCQNGGTCETKQPGYFCECPHGYSGVRCQGSTPQEKIDSGPVIIGSAIGSTLFVSLIVTVIGILLYRKRNAHDKGNRVQGENTPRSLETSTKQGDGLQSTDKEGQDLELQQINSEDCENLNIRSPRTVFYETIHSNPNDQEHVYNDLSSGEIIAYENTYVL